MSSPPGHIIEDHDLWSCRLPKNDPIEIVPTDPEIFTRPFEERIEGRKPTSLILRLSDIELHGQHVRVKRVAEMRGS